ncbi:universal stress protein [Natronobacterium gregoryi]|uniref:Universal stress protein n=2 Tax=Natronobacterium gregoryi TaxID=44930 RepID=L0AEZ6_NATGS|nr:universal stress protein [Natronobacterium gregoryi]AFZ71697.1 universal stress protein UspA-like protein [Natronobacterium gregoryi SP2]ELY72732.1 UspA domain-containing protein [Natronobacterium gregoryi SP2]PLK20256.1 universal stress protein [Natronobacterium gregoryi SP2]SFJ25832.1 Nucleotide-binding universal stress protein, UspA family [Natronobacterium gregoryi]
MPQHVLVPVDGSDHGFAGLEYSLASFPDAALTALYAVDPTHDHGATAGGDPPSTERARERGERVLERAAGRADEYGHDSGFETLLRTGTPHTEILSVAADDDRGIDHVVLGSHGESQIKRPFLGRVSEAIVRRAPVSTTVVPESTTAMRERELPGTALVPVDGSEQADAALEYVLAQFPDADHVAFHALSLPFDRPRSDVAGTYLEKVVTAHERRAEEILESATELADDHDATIETATGDEKPAAAIVEYAETEGVDQIVMGSHGRSLAARLLTGSVAERVARRSPRPVTLVRGRPGTI